jgi:branched-chain amino acid transport system ATP-binding protein
MSTILNAIQRDHRRMSCVLGCLGNVLQDTELSHSAFVEALDNILDFLEAAHDSVHHVVEETIIFPAVRRHDPAAGPLLDRLGHEHAEGKAAAQALKRAFADYRRDRRARPRLLAVAERYIQLERNHIAREERQVIPLALDALSWQDWQRIDAEIAAQSVDWEGRFAPLRRLIAVQGLDDDGTLFAIPGTIAASALQARH